MLPQLELRGFLLVRLFAQKMVVTHHSGFVECHGKEEVRRSWVHVVEELEQILRTLK